VGNAITISVSQPRIRKSTARKSLHGQLQSAVTPAAAPTRSVKHLPPKVYAPMESTADSLMVAKLQQCKADVYSSCFQGSTTLPAKNSLLARAQETMPARSSTKVG
jgi:hypothetical protein